MLKEVIGVLIDANFTQDRICGEMDTESGVFCCRFLLSSHSR
jgi:hypothetical protein